MEYSWQMPFMFLLGLVNLALGVFLVRRFWLAPRRGFFHWGNERIVREEGPIYFKITLCYGWALSLFTVVSGAGIVGVAIHGYFFE